MKRLSALLFFVTLLLALLSAAPTLFAIAAPYPKAKLAWFVLDLIQPWDLHLGALALFLCALAVFFRRDASAVLALIAVGFAAFRLFPAWTPQQSVPLVPPSTQGPLTSAVNSSLTIVQLNANVDQRDPSPIVQWLADNGDHFDIVCINEATHALGRQLSEIKEHYPNQITRAQEDPFGIAMLSKWPLSPAAAASLVTPRTPYIRARIEHPSGQPLDLYAIHAVPPFPMYAWVFRGNQLREINEEMQIFNRPEAQTILCGDLNLTPNSQLFRDFLAATGLKDSAQGPLRPGTWPAQWPGKLLRLPLDHVLVDKDMSTVSVELGPDLGSDHRPLIVTLKSKVPFE